jgi:hypothetical protein
MAEKAIKKDIAPIPNAKTNNEKNNNYGKIILLRNITVETNSDAAF